MATRTEKECESFRQERAAKKKKMVEDFDRETPILEEKMLKKLHDDLLLEYENLNASPRSILASGAEHMSDVKKVTQRKARRVGEYVILRPLGKGNSAQVFECASCSERERKLFVSYFFHFIARCLEGFSVV